LFLLISRYKSISVGDAFTFKILCDNPETARIRFGFAQYINKPYRLGVLMDAIDAALKHGAGHA